MSDHERQPIEKWCEDNEQSILDMAQKLFITISDTASMSEIVSVVHNCPSLWHKYQDDTAPPAPVEVK